MSQTDLPHSLPYGLRKVTITPYVDEIGTTLATTSYAFPIAQTLSFSETEEFDELRGDDRLAAIHGRGAEVDGSIEGGGLSIAVWSAITGGSVVEEGISPNRKRTLRKRGSDARPYFRVDGQMVSDSGGDVIARIYRCKCNGRIQAEFRYGQFQVTSTDFKGTPLPSEDDTNDWLYEIVQSESKTTLTLTPEPNPRGSKAGAQLPQTKPQPSQTKPPVTQPPVTQPPQGHVNGGVYPAPTTAPMDLGGPVKPAATKVFDGGTP